MRFRRWVVFTFAVHVCIILLDKSAGLVLFKILEDQPDVKGAADLLTVLPTIMMALANLGLASSSVYFLRRKSFSLNEVAQTSSLMAIVWGGAVALLAIVVSQFVLPLLRPNWNFSLTYVVPVCLCVPFLLTASYFNSVQIAVDRIRDYNLVNLLSSVVFLPLFLLFFYPFRTEAPTAIALARLAAAVLMALITVWLLRSVVRWRPRLHMSFLRAGLSYGWRANVVSVLTYLNHRLDLFLVPFLFVGAAAFTSDEELRQAQLAQAGFYSLAVTFAELIWHFPEATRDLFFSKVAASTHEQARVFTPTLCRLCFTVGIAGAIGLFLFVDPLMSFISPARWDEKWRATVMTSFEILIPGTVAFTVVKILQNDLSARGFLNDCMIGCAIVLVTMVGLDFWLIPQRGAVGAAWASSIAYLAASVYTLLAYRAHGGAGLRQCLIVRPSDWDYARDMLQAIRDKLRLGARR